MEKLLVSIPDAAVALSVGRTTVYELMRSGQLDTRKMGRRRCQSASKKDPLSACKRDPLRRAA
jgi:excisionase family DNA binding protein